MDELSTLLPAAADTAARTARGTTTALAGAADDLRAAVAATGTWTGTAQVGYAERAATLATRVDLLAAVATAGAGIIEDYSRELGLLKGRLREIDAHLADAQRRTLDTTLTVADFSSTWAAIDRWQLQRRQVLDAFDEATATLAQRLGAVTDHVPDRPRSLAEHVDDAADVLGQQVSGGLRISLGWLDDPGGWWRDVREVPGSLWDEATHPVDTARDTLHVDDLEDGRWGAAGGALAGAVIGRGFGKEVERLTPDGAPGHEGDHRGGAALAPQSLDEMLVGVDLARSEGVDGAHTLQRHVDVDDQYLRDRITLGTLDPATGRRRGTPDRASRWADAATAERVITSAVKANETRLRRIRPGGGTTLRLTVPPEAGTLFVREGEKITQHPVNTAVISIRRAPDGSYSVFTSYLEGS